MEKIGRELGLLYWEAPIVLFCWNYLFYLAKLCGYLFFYVRKAGWSSPLGVLSPNCSDKATSVSTPVRAEMFIAPHPTLGPAPFEGAGRILKSTGHVNYSRELPYAVFGLPEMNEFRLATSFATLF